MSSRPIRTYVSQSISACPYHAKTAKTVVSGDQFLSTINTEFLKDHVDQALSSLDDLDGIIVYKNAELSLWKSKKGELTKCDSAVMIKEDSVYTRIKVISHIAVYITQLMEACIEKKTCDDKDLMKLKALKKMLSSLRADLEKLFMPPDRVYQEQLINESLNALESLEYEIISDKWESCLRGYLSSIAEVLEYNGRRATELQLTALHLKLESWMSHYYLDLKKTRSLIVVTHGPRKDLIESQYFIELYERRLKLKCVEDDRVYCVEMLPSQMAQLKIEEDLLKGFLAQAEHNKKLGKRLQDYSGALSCDVLGRHAWSVIDRLLGKGAESEEKELPASFCHW